MQALLETLSANLVDLLIYGAIFIVTLTGMRKCIFANRSCAHALHKAVRQLEVMSIRDSSRPVWQDSAFLGRTLQVSWRRFLVNAEQLDSRGINCDVEDYINDDTVIYAHCHTQLGDVIPGILTSLGILGTFIGLVRGLGALNLTDAASTMEGISDMISGMNFAFGTSIAGCACSLFFNILHHAAQGSTQKAIDDFHEAFTEFVMQQPLSDNVQSICQREDQAAFLRHSVSEMNDRIAESMTFAVEKSLLPVTQSMNKFIVGETQTQLEGLSRIVTAFVERMNGALGGQFNQLGQTLSSINQAQQMDYSTLRSSLDSAGAIMDGMQNLGQLMQNVSACVRQYADEMAAMHSGSDAFIQKAQTLLSRLDASAEQQASCLLALQSGHDNLQNSMREYAQWSGRVLEAVHQQSDASAADQKSLTAAMRDSSRELSQSYTAFVENISTGLDRTMTLFKENMTGVMNLMNDKLSGIEKAAGADGKSARLKSDTDALLSSLSSLQLALSDMTRCVEGATASLRKKQEA